MSLTLPSLLSINAERYNSEEMFADFFQETLILIGDDTFKYGISFNCFYYRQVKVIVMLLDSTQTHPLPLV